MSPRVLVIDDDASIRRLVNVALSRSGYAVIEAGSARDALASVKADRPDIVLLDLGLPDRDGIELIPLIKAQSDAALLILSARDATQEKVAALDLGADDYVTKPFDTDELLARLRTATRHRVFRSGDQVRIGGGAVEIDFSARTVVKRGEAVHLTPKEFALIEELARLPGRIVTHAHLLHKIWGEAHANDIEYLRVAVRNLRLKLEDDPARPAILTNDPGVGYRVT